MIIVGWRGKVPINCLETTTLAPMCENKGGSSENGLEGTDVRENKQSLAEACWGGEGQIWGAH